MNEHKGGGFFNGFIFGLFVGAGLVFLFGTNKGRRVLQMFLDQIEENTELSDLLEMPDEEDDEYMTSVEEPEEQDIMPEKTNGHSVEDKPQRVVGKVKRFFRGSKKLVS